MTRGHCSRLIHRLIYLIYARINPIALFSRSLSLHVDATSSWLIWVSHPHPPDTSSQRFCYLRFFLDLTTDLSHAQLLPFLSKVVLYLFLSSCGFVWWHRRSRTLRRMVIYLHYTCRPSTASRMASWYQICSLSPLLGLPPSPPPLVVSRVPLTHVHTKIMFVIWVVLQT